MAWNDTKTTFDTMTASEHNAMVTVIESKPDISSGAVAPVSTPSKIGDIYIDTVLTKVYIATGTSSSSDWKILN